MVADDVTPAIDPIEVAYSPSSNALTGMRPGCIRTKLRCAVCFGELSMALAEELQRVRNQAVFSNRFAARATAFAAACMVSASLSAARVTPPSVPAAL